MVERNTVRTPRHDASRAVRAAVEQGLISEAQPVVALLDVAGIRASAAALRAAFARSPRRAPPCCTPSR